ncbi:MAG: Protein-L-isoaspartate O-methyltransferase [Candidatus Fermentimicrarchaeum limneticum]|uniref:Protein-L-isoaspartate O-methyltransferase n=1 Tax=Fermentimicrarchaeum limneticum TaxID=2795018 RepID=A0A7D6BNV2_FERL1|nr:MAG: Protein-L-isoaspartate O-methyltransferase [Candidatus Fermentimicrarchaeum limneticum]
MSGNEEMIELLFSHGYVDERVAEAMRKVPRELFIPEEYGRSAYADTPLPIGLGQTISAPSIVAFMSKSLDVQEGMKVLEIGSGSGYQAAILAELAGNSGVVYTVERIPQLIQLAKTNVEKLSLTNVKFVEGDGTKGYAQESPYDRIIVTAASPSIPQPLVDQLKEGGKLLIPVGSRMFQDLQLVVKVGKEVEISNLMPVVFVPLIGEFGYK